MGTTFAAVRAHARSWELAAVHLKLETNAKEVEKGFSRIEGRSGQIKDQIKRHRELALLRRAKTICETGFNAGHSAASWLKYSNPEAVYYGFDAGRMFHRYPEESRRKRETVKSACWERQARRRSRARDVWGFGEDAAHVREKK